MRLAGFLVCLIPAGAVTTFVTTASLQGATIYKSGTLGLTGLEQGTVDATNVNANVYTGVRFELTEPVVTTEVGGHFVSRSEGTFFGAMVALDDANDFPDSGDLSTPDVLGAAELTFPVPSAEVFGDLSLSLDPGWYALVFGSGLLETAGDGAALRNGSDINEPTYIVALPRTTDRRNNITTFPNHRFVVRGAIIPEPTTVISGWLAAMSFILYLRLRSNAFRH